MTHRNGNGSRPAYLAGVVLGALDLLRAGVLVTGIRSQVLWANRAAESILTSRDGLEVGPEGVLLLSQEGCPLSIELMLQADPSVPVLGLEDSSVKYVQRPSGKRPLTVVVRPTSSYAESQDAEKPAALLFIQDPERPVHILQSDLRQLYGLTVAEGTLANLLMEGSTLEECCKRLSVRPSTVRMHLRNLLNKTGTRGQGELVWLLFRNHGLMSADPIRTTSSLGRVRSQGLSMVGVAQ